VVAIVRLASEQVQASVLDNKHRPHRTLNQAAPLRPLPDGVTDLDPASAPEA
jgi:hypothetical protein